MNIRKHLMATARLVLPTTGLSLICGGAYINSIQSDQMQMLKEVFTYLLIILGFILLVVGVLWSVGHGVKGVLVKWSGGRIRHNDVHVFTVDRASFPPSYEESQVGNPIPVIMQWPGSAPPVYSESSFEICTEDFSHEEPPTYQQAILQNQAAPQTASLPTNSSTEPF
ncbi:transmembrane protein 252-like [Salminus brasiliensis]|uniref:transmembrane protein 252-like n=1 Tax=Salminus brasiliensis TaxID=930266 RepID=UPI003B836B30